MDKTLLILGCLVFITLGGLHAIWTLFTDKFEPRDAALLAEMKKISPKLTRHLTMWDAWVGFNISHSLGIIGFGFVYITIALENYAYLKSSITLNVFLVAFPLIFLVVALKYWFNSPRNGILLGLGLIFMSLYMRTQG